MTEKIVSPEGGYVKVDADQWKAYGDQEFEVGQTVLIVKAEGSSVWVSTE